MADSAAFEKACDELEGSGALDRLAARGTIRLALKASGLEARSVTPDELSVVVERLLPGELEQRGVGEPGAVCRRILAALVRLPADPAREDSPESVFARLGRRE